MMHIPSIKKFLLFNLLLSITITASLTMLGDYVMDNIDIQKQLDIQLKQSAEFINNIIGTQSDFYQIDSKSRKTITNKMNENERFRRNKFQFQITDNQGNLLSHSSKIFIIPLSKLKPGFSTQKIGNKTWRIYTQYNKETKNLFSIGELYNLRAQLEQRITWDNLLIILWTYPILGFFIWLIVNRGFSTFRKITTSIANRSPINFEPIDIKNIPTEIQPLIDELNRLFLRLQHEFKRNKRFASDAAHELRTPLAALKTQTQVALLADTKEKEKQLALNKILQGTNRCIHLVQQLLILSRLSQETIMEEFQPVNLHRILSESLAELVPSALEKNIEISLLDSDEEALIYGNETILSILIRNLVDNAIRYTPNNGVVTTQITQLHDQVTLRVIDNGPGIPPELRARVFERFYRVLGTQTQGSGLGLPIVKQIADLHNATIRLGTPEIGHGLDIAVIFPVYLS